MSNRTITSNAINRFSGVRLSPGDPTGASIVGPGEVHVNTETVYEITDYDYRRTYDITAIKGSVSVTLDKILYIAPSGSGSGGFTVNGIKAIIKILPSKVVKPSIVVPAAGTTRIASSVVIKTSVMALTSGEDIHAATSWQVATNSSFKNPIVNVSKGTNNLTSISVDGLYPNTKYYVRFKYFTENGDQSVWSDAYYFNTKNEFYPENEIYSLGNLSRGANDNFGKAVAISKDGLTTVTGCPNGPVDELSGTGYIIIHEPINGVWTETKKLFPSFSSAALGGATAVAISATGLKVAVGYPLATIVIGATTYTNAGKVVIFSRESGPWVEESVLISSTPVSNEYFGSSLAFSDSGDVLAVSAYGYNNKRGCVYVYRKDLGVWSTHTRLTASESYSGDSFGSSLSINSNGTIVAVGAYLRASGSNKAGKVFVYTNTSDAWAEAIVTASDPTASAYFGSSCSISDDGTKLVVGAYNAAVNGRSAAGKAYIFTKTSGVWTETVKLTPSSRASANAGYAVSISGNGLVVAVSALGGGPSDAPTAGGVYIYSYTSNTWTLTTKLTRSGYGTTDSFGYSLCIQRDGSKIIIGAPFATVSGFSTSGASVLFQ